MGTNKHLSMKSVFSSLCIFLALLATASATSRTGTVVLTQDVTFTGTTNAQYTESNSATKSVIDIGYAFANGITTGTGVNRALSTGVILDTSSVAVSTNVKVTFVMTIKPTFTGTMRTTSNSAIDSALVTAMTDVKTNGKANGGYSMTVPTATQITPGTVVSSTPAPTAAPTANTTNATSSASGIVQFSQIALSIPVVAMVISKIC